MSCLKRVTKLLVWVLFLAPQFAWAWGERGHHIAGYSAAELTSEFLSPNDKQSVELFFSVRKLMLGHLNNIPDNQWKDKRNPLIVKLNGPTHYFDTDEIMGPITHTKGDERLDKIRNLPTDPKEFIALYGGRPSVVAPTTRPKLNIFQDIGVAPFRIGQLYKLLVDSFECATQHMQKINLEKSKTLSKYQKKANSNRKLVTFREPIKKGTFACESTEAFDEALAASVEIGGVLGHFIADLAQPLHTSTDYDGFTSGQKGIHAFIESYALHFLNENLTNEVLEKAKSKSFQKKLWRDLQWPLDKNLTGGRVALHLIAESQTHFIEMLKMDKTFAILKLGEKIPLDDIKNKKYQDAERRPPSDPKVLRGIHDFVVTRLATAALIQARLLVQAWTEGEKPPLKGITHFAYPYPTSVPFILPPEIFIDGVVSKRDIQNLKKEL